MLLNIWILLYIETVSPANLAGSTPLVPKPFQLATSLSYLAIGHDFLLGLQSNTLYSVVGLTRIPWPLDWFFYLPRATVYSSGRIKSSPYWCWQSRMFSKQQFFPAITGCAVIILIWDHLIQSMCSTTDVLAHYCLH